MREIANRSAGDRPPPRSRAAREARIRRRFGVALLASAGAHAALFALPAIEVLPFERAEAGRLVPRVPVKVAERPIEVMQVVQIRPPGPVSSSGGSAEGSAATAGASVPAVSHLAGTRVAPAVARRPTSTPIRSSVRLAMTAIADTSSGVPSFGPPKRGVYQRRGGSAPGASGRQGGGLGGPGRGLGRGSGGVTITGPGGDCITPGIVPRTGTVGLPGLSRPGGARRPGVGRSGRP